MKQGRDRDKQIANMKGLSIGCDRHKWDRIIPISCNICGMGYKERLLIKRWSTSWNDAKELWDELPWKELVKLLLNMATEIGTYDVNHKVDFPNAVSQAWIKWKEADNGM